MKRLGNVQKNTNIIYDSDNMSEVTEQAAAGKFPYPDGVFKNDHKDFTFDRATRQYDRMSSPVGQKKMDTDIEVENETATAPLHTVEPDDCFGGADLKTVL